MCSEINQATRRIGCGLGVPIIVVRILTGARGCPLLQISGKFLTPTGQLLNGKQRSFIRNKTAKKWSWPLKPSSSQYQTKWTCAFPPSYTIIQRTLTYFEICLVVLNFMQCISLNLGNISKKPARFLKFVCNVFVCVCVVCVCVWCVRVCVVCVCVVCGVCMCVCVCVWV